MFEATECHYVHQRQVRRGRDRAIDLTPARRWVGDSRRRTCLAWTPNVQHMITCGDGRPFVIVRGCRRIVEGALRRDRGVGGFRFSRARASIDEFARPPPVGSGAWHRRGARDKAIIIEDPADPRR